MYFPENGDFDQTCSTLVIFWSSFLHKACALTKPKQKRTYTHALRHTHGHTSLLRFAPAVTKAVMASMWLKPAAWCSGNFPVAQSCVTERQTPPRTYKEREKETQCVRLVLRVRGACRKGCTFHGCPLFDRKQRSFRFFLELRLHSQIWADPWQPFRDARCLSVASLELLWRNEKGKIDIKENRKNYRRTSDQCQPCERKV